jgi:hypothetical protein
MYIEVVIYFYLIVSDHTGPPLPPRKRPELAGGKKGAKSVDLKLCHPFLNMTFFMSSLFSRFVRSDI